MAFSRKNELTEPSGRTSVDVDWADTKVSTTHVGEKLAVTDEIRQIVTVVLPVLNEETAIGPLVDQIKLHGYSHILVVDGYSGDRTVEVARARETEVVSQWGVGKAGALLTAFSIVVTPLLLVMDGDGSYDPKDIDKFVVLMDRFDLVKGVRSKSKNMSKLHKVGNWIISKNFDFLFGTEIRDVCSGMYMMRTEVVRKVRLNKHPLTVEQEVAAEIVDLGGRITTVPISYGRRQGGISKTHTWRQGFLDFWTNFDLARTHNPIMLFSGVAMLFLIPAIVMLGTAAFFYIVLGSFRSGYFLAGLVLLVLGAQGFTVATIGVMLKRIERRLSQR